MDNLGFFLPDGIDFNQLTTALREQYPTLTEPGTVESAAVFDTFDWRLFNKSLALYHARNELQLRRLSDGELVQSLYSSEQPTFARDLPKSDLREQLEPIIDIRALIRLIEIHTHSTSLRILNQEDKTVARVVYEEIAPSLDDSKGAPVTQVWLRPVRGYPGYFRDLVDYFENTGYPAHDYQEIFTKILAAVGRTPGDYSAKLGFQLSPEMRADDATKVIFRFLLQVMRINEKGIRDDIDTEFLHDFRVAVRRTRSALTQVKDVFPAEIVGQYKTDFAFLGQLTNPLRDLDVYLLKEGSYKSLLPPVLRKDIEPLFEHLRSTRSQALENVIEGLHSDEYAHLIQAWQAFLNETPAQMPEAPNAGCPIIDVANGRIYKRYRSILKTGGELLDRDDDEEGLHALRIECKKLRYLLEFFTSLYPQEQITLLITQLKKLQDNLGDFNDLCIQIEYLLNIVDQISLTDSEGKKTLLAIGCLIGRLDHEKQVVLDAFAETFTGFASPTNRKLFRKLFANNLKGPQDDNTGSLQ